MSGATGALSGAGPLATLGGADLQVPAAVAGAQVLLHRRGAVPGAGHGAPPGVRIVIPIVSAVPGSPLSVIVTWSVAFVYSVIGLDGLVMSWIVPVPA